MAQSFKGFLTDSTSSVGKQFLLNGVHMQPHELAELFPMMTCTEMQDLVLDIKAKGQLNPIITLQGKILDGRNRYLACQELGIQPVFVEYSGNDPLGDVISWNLKRRHLSEAQRAHIAVNLANIKHGGDRKSDQAANLPFEITQSEAAEKLNISERSLRTAKKIQEEAIPEITELSKAGEMSLHSAVMAASLPEDEQKEIIEEINSGIKPSEAVKIHVLATKYTGDEEWYTPKIYIDSARAVLGEINIDPASNNFSQKTINADVFYTIDDDGLTKEWSGKVWMNPPYTARVINRFIEKLVNHFQAGEVTEAIILTNSNTDTSWFHQGASEGSAVCFTSGRINFLKESGEKSSPTNGQSFIYFGKNIEAFKAEFLKHGLVMVKA